MWCQTRLTSTLGIVACVRLPALVLAILLLLAGARYAASHTGDCRWYPVLASDGLDGPVMAFAVHDGELYAGGGFTGHIARWNGSSWITLSGALGDGPDAAVTSLAVYDDGRGEALYAGGYFRSAGGRFAGYIARWDGSSWGALSGPAGTGADKAVRALAVVDGALYAGGDFTTIGGILVNHIARWDGSGWSALSGAHGTGTDRSVNALAAGGSGLLYVGGKLSSAGGVPASHIAVWDGAQWFALGSGTDMPVHALAIATDEANGEILYVGGEFSYAGGQYALHVAGWDGRSWFSIGRIEYNAVLAMTMYDDGSDESLYVAGCFHDAAGQTVKNIARWDGSQWSDLYGPLDSGIGDPNEPYNWGRALAVYDDGRGPVLFAGGEFTSAGGLPVNNVARWDGHRWSGPARSSLEAGPDGVIHTLLSSREETGEVLYAGGEMSTIAGMTVNHIARWDGVSWSPLTGPVGSGTNGPVWTLAVYDDGAGEALYAGGEMGAAGGVAIGSVGRWDGNQWSKLDDPAGGPSGPVWTLAVHDEGLGAVLFAGGSFLTAGGAPVRNIARWNGSTWSVLGSPSMPGTNSWVMTLAEYDDGTGAALYAGGSFTTAGGVPVNHIARWDGSGWSALVGPAGIGTDAAVTTMAVFDDGDGAALYAGGWFTTAGGLPALGIARWDGTWRVLDSPTGLGYPGQVYALAAANQGLYAGGLFTTAGGALVNHIVSWDGRSWSPLSGPWGTGCNDWVEALAVYDGATGASLFAGGGFSVAGGATQRYLARWSCDEVFSDSFESGNPRHWSRCQP